jgi:hypothetical protein
MNHNQARLQIGADPHGAPSSELSEHLASCPECAQFQREMVTLDGNIRKALELGVRAATGTQAGAGAQTTGSAQVAAATGAAPASSVTPITGARAARQRKSTNVWSGWALAASVAVVSVLAILALRPSDTLAHEIVAHVEYESDSWSQKQPVPASEVNDALANAGVALDMSSDKVMYAHSCYFRGHFVPHLVVSTARGPITVIVLPDVKVKRRTTFHEDGMSGVITPAPRGSIAVLALGDENIDAVAQQVQQSVHWLPAGKSSSSGKSS